MENQLESLAVDANGEYAIAGDHEGNLLLFDLKAGRLLNHAAAHRSWVTAVAINTSSGIALSGSWGQKEPGIRLWRLFDLSPTGVLSDHGPSVEHLALSRDGRWAFSSTRESVAVWNLGERKLIRRYDMPGNSITDIAVTEDRRIVASYLDASIKIWGASGEVRNHLGTLKGHYSPISDIAMRKDGHLVASTARSDPDIALWDVSTGTPCGRLTGHGNGILALTMLPDGKTLVSAGQDKLIIGWDLGAAKELWRLEVNSDQITSLAHMEQESGQLVISGDLNGDVLFWEPHCGKVVGALPRREADKPWRSHPPAVRSLSARPKYGQLLVGTENSVEIWDVASLQRIHVYSSVLPAIYDSHYAVALHCLPDERVVSAFTDGLVLVHHVDSRIEAWTDDVDNVRSFWAGAVGLAASDDGKYLVLATKKKAVQIINMATGQNFAVFIGDSEMLACACSVDASIIAAGDAEGKVHILHRHRSKNDR